MNSVDGARENNLILSTFRKIRMNVNRNENQGEHFRQNLQGAKRMPLKTSKNIQVKPQQNADQHAIFCKAFNAVK